MNSKRIAVLVVVSSFLALVPSSVFATDSFPTKKAVVTPKEDAPPPVEVNGKMLKPEVAGLEVYGTTGLNEKKLRDFLGDDLKRWFDLGLKGDPKAVELEAKLSDRLKAKFGFAAADWSIVQYFEPSRVAMYVTLDVVTKEDAAKRANFLAPPTKEFADPGKLVKAWLDYETLALKMVEQGKLNPEPGACVAYHCPFGHKEKELQPFEKTFVEGAVKYQKELIQIASEDKRSEYRAAAVYILPYLKEGKTVVDAMVKRIRDPEPLVRNNALRVLGDIAEFHPEVVIPKRPVLEALDFPRVSDRSKALYVTYVSVVHSPEWKDELMKSEVPQLLKLMTSLQPDHREISNGILKKISGKDFASTDTKAWTKWASTVQAERDVAKK